MDGLNGWRGARVDRGMVWAMGPYGPYLVRPPLYPTTPSIWTPAPPQPPLLLPPSPSGPNSIVPTGTSQGRVCALCGGAGGHQCVSEYKGAPFKHFLCRYIIDPRPDITVMSMATLARVFAAKAVIGAPCALGYKCGGSIS
jgi:hypothetical protein